MRVNFFHQNLTVTCKQCAMAAEVQNGSVVQLTDFWTCCGGGQQEVWPVPPWEQVFALKQLFKISASDFPTWRGDSRPSVWRFDKYLTCRIACTKQGSRMERNLVFHESCLETKHQSSFIWGHLFCRIKKESLRPKPFNRLLCLVTCSASVLWASNTWVLFYMGSCL